MGIAFDSGVVVLGSRESGLPPQFVRFVIMKIARADARIKRMVFL
jgi:hypothetical protein